MRIRAKRMLGKCVNSGGIFKKQFFLFPEKGGSSVNCILVYWSIDRLCQWLSGMIKRLVVIWCNIRPVGILDKDGERFCVFALCLSFFCCCLFPARRKGDFLSDIRLFQPSSSIPFSLSSFATCITSSFLVCFSPPFSPPHPVSSITISLFLLHRLMERKMCPRPAASRSDLTLH